MSIIKQLRDRAKSDLKTIVLPEGEEGRTIQAARKIVDEKIAHPVLLGDIWIIQKKADDLKIEVSDVECQNVQSAGRFDEYVSENMDIRKSKGITEPEAQKIIARPEFFAAMMVRQNHADGFVAGAVTTTSNVLRAAIRVIGMKPGISVVSSCFLMVMPNGKNYTFADSGVVPDPTAEELAGIAISSAETHLRLTGEKPYVGMLSFSTRGSAKHPILEKVVEATQIIKNTAPDLIVDGELQVDAAIVPEIAAQKAPDSAVQGRANVLIYPDLNAGNIAYKLVQRLGHAKALGPLIQGLNKPAHDLSRGCSADDIVDVVAICSVMAQN